MLNDDTQTEVILMRYCYVKTILVVLTFVVGACIGSNIVMAASAEEIDRNVKSALEL